MKYNYYFKKGNEEYRLVTLSELKYELNKICLKHTYINEWISIGMTDLKYVEKVIREIKKGTHYVFSNNASCYAKKVVR